MAETPSARHPRQQQVSPAEFIRCTGDTCRLEEARVETPVTGRPLITLDRLDPRLPEWVAYLIPSVILWGVIFIAT